jgi:hypothetical protein
LFLFIPLTTCYGLDKPSSGDSSGIYNASINWLVELSRIRLIAIYSLDFKTENRHKRIKLKKIKMKQCKENITVKDKGVFQSGGREHWGILENIGYKVGMFMLGRCV